MIRFLLSKIRLGFSLVRSSRFLKFHFVAEKQNNFTILIKCFENLDTLAKRPQDQS
jgi:hypothetical protein